MKNLSYKKRKRCFMREWIKTFIFTNLLLLSFSQAQGKIRSYQELRFSDINKQSAEFTCGVAVLATLWTYYYGIKRFYGSFTHF
jgi:predicted double-glycine peptidase